jgi:hypothetical protein
VDHRDASLGTVNAQGYGNATKDGASRMGFNLLDAASTISISAKPRIAWHEFGHELLFEHVGGPNFGFAHSAGDSLGVIMLDPDSQAPDRFLTFPFCPTIVRRHDRPVSGGWGGLAAVGYPTANRLRQRCSACIARPAGTPATSRNGASQRATRAISSSRAAAHSPRRPPIRTSTPPP